MRSRVEIIDGSIIGHCLFSLSCRLDRHPSSEGFPILFSESACERTSGNRHELRLTNENENSIFPLWKRGMKGDFIDEYLFKKSPLTPLCQRGVYFRVNDIISRLIKSLIIACTSSGRHSGSILSGNPVVFFAKVTGCRIESGMTEREKIREYHYETVNNIVNFQSNIEPDQETAQIIFPTFILCCYG